MQREVKNLRLSSYLRLKGKISSPAFVQCIYRWSVIEIEVTSTPNGGGGTGYLFLQYVTPINWNPAINLAMVIELKGN